MSRKHFFNNTEGVVVNMLQSLVSRNAHMGLDEANRVVYSKTHKANQVSIVSGGGSGHEPAWSGFVGEGMLSAAVCGDIFASPSTKQVMAGIRNAPSTEGVILCITNYTGDMLHFGLAREKGQALGYKVDVVCMAEDAALGREKSGKVGRRGLAGNLLVIKLTGAASQKGWSFERCRQIGELGNSQLVTIGSSLDHCHVPGREAFEHVPDNSYVLGMGIHNEPGLKTITPMPPPETIISEMLRFLLDPKDTDRAFVEFKPEDNVVMLVNNFGGLSGLELEALVNIALKQLEKDWKIKPARIYAGILETSLNGQGFSITLGNMSGMAKAMKVTDAEVFELLDAPTTAPAWPKNGYAPVEISKETEELRQKANAAAASHADASKGPATPSSLIPALRKACNDGFAAEPTITQYDLQMGDGDCGEAVAGVCKSILNNLDSLPSTLPPLIPFLESVGENVEDVGGSLGAILSILVTAFTNALTENTVKSSKPLDVSTVADSAAKALDNLKNYTSAREGDRTVMDVLIPFIDTFAQTKDLAKAVDVAEKKADDTKNMKAKFGRATYVGDENAERSQIPDPGAYAAGVWLRGLLEGYKA
ncbi:dihydroxyacetone kinase-like protein [Aaosphaeria arxii CBS 175.79]|uniref:Dihydroxyacetone kinase-like protein n=1 Tax=Aaosphaeria arxii CBS 175.79 TaxID=1450172 RepID=A0A6A5XF08_9PLEO|nr:dihydroxyacetone kinase-like protein [Aaosphaeria arxii CBS 175.79]KAF2011449.1 dihydroxyacetone kinase-like protein [Aaosphaeria arxii CBS 175.79]